jgi:hypothetical protein
MKTLTTDEYERLQKKADMYDEIESKIASFYDDDLEDDEVDLCDMGLYIASYFGWL